MTTSYTQEITSKIPNGDNTRNNKEIRYWEYATSSYNTNSSNKISS